MQTKTQFSRGNFSTFFSRARSNIDNPLPPNLIATRAAGKLSRDFGIEVQPEDLIYDKGALKGDFDGNVSLSPEELYELSQIRERYNDESIKIIHKE